MASGQLAAVCRQVHRLFSVGTVAGLDEGGLLDRFVDSGDDAAFEAIVARHGPMVLSVCRSFLRDPNDAEDAFQATFLVLVRRAHSLRDRDRLGGWLYGVALRVARRARAEAARRHRREATGPEPAGGEAGDDAEAIEIRPLIHDEVARLPESYRAAVVLCYLEGRTHEEAARTLGWPLGTVKGRLARARERLRGGLMRRGLAPTAGAVVATLAREGRAAVPPSLLGSTVAGALATARVAGPFSVGLSALDALSPRALALTQGVSTAMPTIAIKLAASLLVAASILSASARSPGGPAPLLAPARPAPVAKPAPKAAPDDGPAAPASKASAEARLKIAEELVGAIRLQIAGGANSPEIRGRLLNWERILQATRAEVEGPSHPYLEARRRLDDLRALEAKLKAEADRGPNQKVAYLSAQFERMQAEEQIETLRNEPLPAEPKPAPAEPKPPAPQSSFGEGGGMGEGFPDGPTGRPRKENPADLDRNARIEQVLETPLAFSFPAETPLADVLKYVRDKTRGGRPFFPAGLPIYVDPAGLQETNLTPASAVTIVMEGIPLRTTLRLLLAQLDLDYRVRDGLILVGGAEWLRDQDRRFLPSPRPAATPGVLAR